MRIAEKVHDYLMENTVPRESLQGTFSNFRGYFPLTFSAWMKRGMLDLGGLVQFRQAQTALDSCESKNNGK